MKILLLCLSGLFFGFGFAAINNGDESFKFLFAFGFSSLFFSFIIKKKKPSDSHGSETDTNAYNSIHGDAQVPEIVRSRTMDVALFLNQHEQDCVMIPDIIRPRIMDGMAFLKSHAGHYVAFDLETTGLSPQNDAIIEIGAVKVKDGEIIETFSTFVQPGRHIPEAATAVNHITDDMVSSAPGIAQALSLFQAFVGSLPCVAHNCSFDSGFLATAGMNPLPPFADTLSMARRLFPALPNKKLVTVCEAISYEIGQAHRALDDAKAVSAIVQACYSQMERLAKLESDYLHHMELGRKIEADYKSCKEHDGDITAYLDAVLALCQEDFPLIPSAREYAALKGWPEPGCGSFRRAIIILTQRKDYDRAIAVCQQAIALGIPDKDTKGGMAGRLDRLLAQKVAYLHRKDQERSTEEKRVEKQRQKEEKRASQAAKTSAPSNKRSVLQYSYDGAELIKVHDSIASAAREIGIDKSCIRDAVHGKQKHAGGFTWRFDG